MRSRSLIILAVLTVVVVAAAVIAARYRAPQTAVAKELLFPELEARINDVAGIRVAGRGRSVSVVRRNDEWVISNADDYPALFGKVKETVVGVSRLRVLEGKTRNPELFPRLGVEDPESRGADSVMLSLHDAGGKVLAEFIAGRDRMSAAPGDSPGLYVRLPEGEQALLVEGRLDASVELVDWLERDLFDIPGERIREVTIRHGDGETVRLQRSEAGADLELLDIPAGMEVKSEVVVRRMETLLERIFINGVRAADGLSLPGDATRVNVSTFNGLVADITIARVDGSHYALFSFSAEPGAAPTQPVPAEPEADAPAGESADEDAGEAAASEPPGPEEQAAQLNGKTHGWAFALPEYKFEVLNRRMADLIREPGTEQQPELPPLPE